MASAANAKFSRQTSYTHALSSERVLNKDASPSSTHPLNNWSTETGQSHEDDFAEIVVVCQPGLPKLMGSLHPAGSLYEKPVNTQLALEQHSQFKKVLEQNGVRVMDVRNMLTMHVDIDMGARIELEEYAAQSLKYELDKSCDERLLKPEESYYVGNNYKRQVLQAMSSDQLVDIILTNPTVHVRPSLRDTQFTASYSFQPLTNTVFTRDQQVTTRKGIVMASLSSEQRSNEVKLMKFCFRKMGFRIAGEITGDGRLEGGDFFAAGDDLCFVGIGLRSNMQAVQQMLDNDWFGTRRVAVVDDQFERNQDRMHLDCVFSILGRDCCLMLEDMMGEASPIRRVVHEYTREISADGKPTYKQTLTNVEFSSYVKQNGYNIIPIKAADQLVYACNVLNLGHGNVLSPHAETARQLAASPYFKGHVRFVDFSGITAMYGALHCSTQVIRRGAKPPTLHRHVEL